MSQQVSVRIDGELCTATEGQTIFEVARANGRYIPALCHMEGLSSAGTCRLCLVEVAGIGPAAARLHDARPQRHVGHHQFGQSGSSSPDGVGVAVRRAQPLFARCACPTAIASCRRWRRSWASPTSASPTTIRACRWTRRIPASCSTTTAASFARVASASATRSKAPTSGTSPRAASTRFWSSDLDRPWGDSANCTSCGKCVQVCPTGALAEKGQAVEEMTKRNRRRHQPRREERGPPMKKARVATLWLDGCSGCHMSLLDIDEAIIAVAQRADIVYGPLVDAQEFPARRRRRHRRGRRQQPGRSRENPARPRAHAASWWRSAIARSPAMFRRCAIGCR